MSTQGLKFRMGFTTLFRGFKEIFSDLKIFLYTLIPVLISAVVVFVLFKYGWELSSQWAERIITDYIPSYLLKASWVSKTIYWIINVVFKFMVILVLTYFSFIFIQLVSIPFYSLICERILFKRGVFPDRPFRISTWIRVTIRMFVVSIIRMCIFLVIWVLVFIVSLIPGLQFISIFYSALMVGMDSLDYTVEIYEMSLGRRIGLYVENFAYFSAVGLVLLPFLLVPGLILLLLPVTVVGMSVQFAETMGRQEYEKLIA